MAEQVAVVKDGERTWSVTRGEEVVGQGLTHSAAWKLHDRLSEEVTSPSEKRQDYGWQRYALD